MTRFLERALWAIFLLTLPVTSFPFFPPVVGGEALVRPLALYPLLLLIPLVILPRLARHPIPKTLLPLLFFMLVAAASSLLSLLRGIEPALGVSANARALRGLSTLAIGGSIYLAILLLPASVEDLRFSLRWIYIGGALSLLWGSLQALYVFRFDQAWFDLLSNVQQYLSTRRLLPDRISGLTYEPHWFAEQLTLLLLPWLLASILTQSTVFRWRWRGLTVEWLLLGWLVLLLPFTYSRSGVLNALILGMLGLVLWLRQNWNKSRLLPLKWQTSVKIALIVLAVMLPVYLVGSRNAFFARLWEYWRKEGASLVEYMSYLGFDARMAYSEAAYNTYEAFPILGVGLGNYAFYFEEMLPDRPIAAVPEVLRMITPEKGRDRLITSKNLYLRLLGETGIVGTVSFMAFLIATLGCALFLRLSPGTEWLFWGVGSLLGLSVFILSAFTFDSFVIPNMWVVLGLIASAARVQQRHEIRVNNQL